MGKSSPSPPPPPDPIATATAQGVINADTARLQGRMNRLDQVTPYGSLTYEDLGNDRSRATTTLSDAQTRLLNLSNQAQETYGTAALNQLQSVRGQLSTPFSYSGPSVQSQIADRTAGVQVGLPDRSREILRDVQDRTGELQRNVQDRSGNIQRGVDLGNRADFTGIGDPNQSRDAVEAALMARMNPSLTSNRNALEARLINQGITPGSQAWETGMRDYGMQENDARYGAILNAGQEQSRVFGLGFGQTDLRNRAALDSGNFANAATGQASGMDLARGQFANFATGQAMADAIARGQFANAATGQASGMDLAQSQFRNQAIDQLNQSDLQWFGFQNQAQQQLYGMDMGRAQFNNAAAQQSLQQQLALRGQPINEASALLSGQQIQAPQFANVPQTGVQAADYQGAVAQNYAAANAQYNAQLQRGGADTAAIAGLLGRGLGGLAFRYSDRRLKRDVKRIGTGFYGLPIYRYDYLWSEPAIGYMADEVAAVAPHAIMVGHDGFAQVNYGALK